MISVALAGSAQATDAFYGVMECSEDIELIPVPDPESLRRSATISTAYCSEINHEGDRHKPVSIYELPASWTLSSPDWHNLWLNTAVYAGAMVGTLGVLECLPEDATSWNRAEIQQTPMFKRWFRNVFKLGPKWDTDSWIFNYIMHPYAGAVYFMSARSSGFNYWGSLLYCTCISSIFWEFGIEAFMERPSIQDLFVTPLVGSLIGEGFYRLKRRLVADDFRRCSAALWPSSSTPSTRCWASSPATRPVPKPPVSADCARR